MTIDRTRLALARSQELADEGRPDVAAAMVELVLAEAPEHPNAPLLLWRASDLEAQQGHVDAAVEAARRARRAAPEHPGIAVQLAWVLLRVACDAQGAQTAWREALPVIWPEGALAQDLAADPGLARRARSLAVALGSPTVDDPDAYLDHADWVQWQEGAQAALEVLDRGLAHTDDGRLELLRSSLLARLGRPEESAAAARAAAASAPDDLESAVQLLWQLRAVDGPGAAHVEWVQRGRKPEFSSMDIPSLAAADPELAVRTAVLLRELAQQDAGEPYAARAAVTGSLSQGVGRQLGLESFRITAMRAASEIPGGVRGRTLATAAVLDPANAVLGLTCDARGLLVSEGVDKAAAREQPFIHTFLRSSACSVLDIPLTMLDRAELPPHQPQRFVFSPGRVGSTLLVRILRDAGIAALSESEAHHQIATAAYSGMLDIGLARELSSLATWSLLDRPVPRAVNKLHAGACAMPGAVMSEGDDAVMLWRGIEATMRSWWRAWWPVRTQDWTHIVDRIALAVRAHAELAESGRLVATLWYEDIASGRPAAAADAFSDLLHESALAVPSEDVQAGTPLSRASLAGRAEPPMAELMDLWSRSPALPLARELGLDGLLPPGAALRRVRPRTAPIPVLPIPHRGSVEHYFHFLLGYLLPVVHEFGQDRPALLLRECGPMTRHLLELAEEWSIEIAPRDSLQEDAADPGARSLVGYDHPGRYPSAPLRASADRLMDILDLVPAWGRGETPRILVIDRGEADPFYGTSAAEVPNAGRGRRSVPNLADVAAELAGLGGVQVAALEEASLKDQMQLFSSADAVIAQHGAALANLLWCRPGTRVIEIEHRRPRPAYFRDLARILGLRWSRVAQDHDHAPVDPTLVASVLRRALDGP